MRKSAGPGGKIAIDMTPMIDIVFQLLIFFVMTLKLAPPEGDLAMQMPSNTPGPARPRLDDLPSMTLTLHADEQGNCSQVLLNERSFAGKHRWVDLHDYVAALVGDVHRASAEVQIVADFDLRHEHTVQAITALSGSLDPQGDVVPLIEKIRFAPPSEAGGAQR